MKEKTDKTTVVVGRYMSPAYIEFIKSAFEEVEIVKYSDLVEGRVRADNVDIVLFSGGADVNPDMYAEKLGKFTNIDKTRDLYERDMLQSLNYYRPLNVGICRGAQLLTVLSGGSLIQHVEGHTSPHDIDVPSLLTTVEATSTHHQMMYPYELKETQYDMVAWSRYFQSTTYLNGRNEEIELDQKFLEPEIVFYKNTNSLAIQGHPEMNSAGQKYKKVCRDLIKIYLKRVKQG